MDEGYLRSLVYNAITAIKSGEKNSARNYLDRALYSARDHDMLADIWFYLSEIEEDKAAKRKALEEALSYRMTHARARRALAILDGRLKADEVINPDAAPVPPTGDEQGDAERFMCPNCGARMSFAPDGQSLVCDYCNSGERIDESGDIAEERDFFSTMATLRGHSKPIERKVFHCEGCGAQFILPANDISENCPYCNSPYVVSHQETRELLDPDAIIPHAFQQREATQKLIDWVNEHRFTPQRTVLRPRGFYLPIWTFDFAGFISYVGERYEEEKNNSLLMRSNQRVKVTERGEYPVYIDDLVIPASHDYKKQITNLIESYHLREAKPYDPRYLSSWAAEAYDIALGDASLEARKNAYELYKKKIKVQFRNLMNLHTSSANLAIDSYKLLMLPLWIASYVFDDKEYLVLINGETGVVRGELPKQVAQKKKREEKDGLFDWLGDLI